MSPSAKRNLARQASERKFLASELRTGVKLDDFVQRVHEVLQHAPHLQYKKMKRSPALADRHKQDQIEWSTAHVTRRPCKWEKIVLSNEKHFNFGLSRTLCILIACYP